ncbi:MAG: N-acetyltransferase [Clostridiales bacterium]|jgi:hypothetical protein|nr:N-acetyltransferase [Clostridiales bacterium]
MTGYTQVNLKDMIEALGHEKTKVKLSEFSCPLNRELELFARQEQKAIEFAKQNIATTHLVYASFKGEVVLVGYYTLAIKALLIENKVLSNSMSKRISKFGQKVTKPNRYLISAPLIAQLGKNFNNGYDKLISGAELLDMACEKVRLAQSMLGGKIVYLECEEKSKLIEFYERYGFVKFGKRAQGREDKDIMHGEYLVQMLRYLNT